MKYVYATHRLDNTISINNTVNIIKSMVVIVSSEIESSSMWLSH